MRKYTGDYPNRIREVSSMVPGIALVKTNNGGAYYISSRDTDGVLPCCGFDVFDYKFTRAQPMTFQQDAMSFHRMLDGYALPFVEYVGSLMPRTTHLDELEKTCRKLFTDDMVRQGVLPRITTAQRRPAAQEGTTV